MRLNTAAAVFCAAIFLQGCTLLTETPAQSLTVGGVEIANRSAETQMVLFVTPDDVEKMCLAPAPDAVVSFSEGLTAGQFGETDGETAQALGGRSAIVLLTRELMYRACEFSQNYDLSKDEAYDLYLKHLNAIVQISNEQAELEGEDTDEDTDEDD